MKHWERVEAGMKSKCLPSVWCSLQTESSGSRGFGATVILTTMAHDTVTETLPLLKMSSARSYMMCMKMKCHVGESIEIMNNRNKMVQIFWTLVPGEERRKHEK